MIFLKLSLIRIIQLKQSLDSEYLLHSVHLFGIAIIEFYHIFRQVSIILCKVGIVLITLLSKKLLVYIILTKNTIYINNCHALMVYNRNNKRMYHYILLLSTPKSQEPTGSGRFIFYW